MARSIDTQQSTVRGFVPAQNDEERFLMRHVEDLARAAFGRGIARYSAFLSDREQQLAQAALNRAGAPEESCRFEGGWPDAERRVLCLEPEDCYLQALSAARRWATLSCRRRSRVPLICSRWSLLQPLSVRSCAVWAAPR